MEIPSLFDDNSEFNSEPQSQSEPVTVNNNYVDYDDDGYDDEHKNSPLTRYPTARRHRFRQYPRSHEWRTTLQPGVTFDTLNFRFEARKFSAITGRSNYLCFILAEPYNEPRNGYGNNSYYNDDEPYRMLMNHPEYLDFSDVAFRIFTVHDHELEVRYTRSTKYIALHDQKDASAKIWLMWNGTVIEAESDPSLAVELARVLCCLDLLTKEVERALAVSVRAVQKKSWLAEFKRRLRNVC